MKFITTFTGLLLSASTIVLAAPLDVWSPEITYPTEDAVWHAGRKYPVVWSLDGKPDQVTNPIGEVFLSKDGILDIDHPLANGFKLTNGHVFVTVPKDTVPGTDYAVVLVGDSGNSSPQFTIKA